MPSELKCIIHGAKNLPIMEKSRNTTDAYCEVHFGKSEIRKTPTIYNNLEPQWDTTFTFESINDEELQESVLKIVVVDEDVISRDDPIGQVIIDLSSLLNINDRPNIKGQFPIYDISNGLRGSLDVEVKLTFVRDQNTAKTIKFFSTSSSPQWIVKHMLGFVEELVDFKRTEKDTENMILIQEGCLKLRRKLGKAVNKRSGNAIISYRQVLDNEGAKSKRIVIRGYGTTAFLVSRQEDDEFENPSSSGIMPGGLQNSLQSKNYGAYSKKYPNKFQQYHYQIPSSLEDKPKVQFITSNTYPIEVNMWFGSTVSARSVRLISQKTTERDSWWGELRHEITKNAMQLSCTHILGYREIVSIYEDVMVLNIIGTAVKISDKKIRLPDYKAINHKGRQSPIMDATIVPISKSNSDIPKDLKSLRQIQKGAQELQMQRHPSYPSNQPNYILTTSCQFCHIVHNKANKESISKQMNLFKCLQCNRDYVPEVIVATIDPPEGLQVIGIPKFIEARIVKQKKNLRGEQHAISVSGQVFFLEYHLHSQLIKKMKLYCKNAIFSLRVSIIIAGDIITGIASGTAVCLKALPIPMPLQIKENEKLIENKEKNFVFIKNLEKLSCLNIEQCFSSDCFTVSTPNHFKQQVAISKRKDSLKPQGSGKSPNKFEDEKNRSFSGKVLNGFNPASPDFTQSRPLRTISEEAYLSQSHDHQRLILKKMGQRNVSEDIDLERSDSDQKNQNNIQQLNPQQQHSQPIKEIHESLMGYSIDRKTTSDPNQNLFAISDIKTQYKQNTRGQIVLNKYKDQFAKCKVEITEEIQKKTGDRIIDDELLQVVTTYNNNQSELFKDLFGTREVLQVQSPQMQTNHNQDFYEYLNENTGYIINSQDYLCGRYPSNYDTLLQGKASFIIELDDDKDLDILKGLLDPYLPPNIVLQNSEFDMFGSNKSNLNLNNVDLVHKSARYYFNQPSETKINQAFSQIIQQGHLDFVAYILQQKNAPCIVCSLKSQVKINDQHYVDMVFSACLIRTTEDNPIFKSLIRERDMIAVRTDIKLPHLIKEALDEQGIRQGEHDRRVQIDISTGETQISKNNQTLKQRGGFFNWFKCAQKQEETKQISKTFESNNRIKLLPMSIAPGMKIKKYLGIVDVHLIRIIRIVNQDEDHVSLMIDQVIDEVFEIAKARVESMSGNCLLSMRMDINTLDQQMSSQMNILISCFGDVVELEQSEIEGDQQ